ncbi:hypothetical protein BDZ97DRAFT_1836777 [Flammula alnicola]|nr:hypothetical protein BDZ97DRAFT_1836777 [Flammula alnicola]
MMASFSTRGILDEKRYNFMPSTEDLTHLDEIARLKKELELLKNANPFLVAEIALELQIERLRVVEITNARDAALQRLSDAYVSIRQKNEIIERMQEERESNGAAPFPTHLIRVRDTVEIDKLKAHIATLESTIEDLRSVVRELPQSGAAKPIDPPPSYEENIQKSRSVDAEIQTDPHETENPPPSEASLGRDPADGEPLHVPPQTDDPKELVKARNAVLAVIPLPPNPPDDTLSAIVIPPPSTLHELLNSAPAPLKNALSSYRILQNNTTTWCPDREEHGYMYSPAFKCSTNPRIATAHRWSAVDVIGRMSKPTECFYHKEGVWYYAGSYKAFRLDNLSTKEWAQLPAETISAIVKETITGRKNNSPQNTYETSQLYAAGALKVACVGLQCVGFNQEVYKAIIEHSIKFSEAKFKALAAQGATGTPAAPAKTPAAAKTPVMPRHAHRASTLMGSAGSVGAGSPSGQAHLPGTPVSGGIGTLLGSGSSIWNMSTNMVASPPSAAADSLAATKVFGGGENSAMAEAPMKR